MYTADKAFWHEKMNTNRYFATLSVLFAMLAGIVSPRTHSSECHWLADSFLKWNIYPSLLAAVGVMIVLIALNVCESIIGARDFISGLLRLLWMTVVIGIVFLLGYFMDSFITDFALLAMAALLVVEALISFGIAANKSLTALNN